MSDNNSEAPPAPPVAAAAPLVMPSSTTESGELKPAIQFKEENDAYKQEMYGKGVAPIKKEHHRTWKEGERVKIDADDKKRGMNKGSTRDHVKVEGSGTKPTFPGEVNFLEREILQNVKAAIRGNQKRDRGDNKHPSKLDEKKEDAPVPAATEEPKAVTTEAPVVPAVTTEAPVVAAVTTEEQHQPKGELDGEAITVTTTAQKDAQAKNKDSAGWKEYIGLPADDQRDRQAKSRHMFENRTIMAPLTTVGNLPFRRICCDFGVDNTVSEMAMVYNLNKTQKSEWSLLRRHESEGTFGIQIAVNRADDAASFARAIESSGFSYDYIDINCGCPVDLICKRGCGCGLWEKRGKLRDITKALNQFQSKPVTIKCRVGIDENNPTLHRIIDQYESWGAAAVTVHGRSKQQRYTKMANWNYIDQVSYLTNLPVVGNGDVFSYQDVLERREIAPKVTSYMLGRGCLIKPWVYTEIKEERVWDISSHERFEMLKKFCSHGLDHWGSDERGVETTRRFLCEWLGFLHRYIPVGLMEVLPQRMNERPPPYYGRDDMETLMGSDSVEDWIKISEMLLGPCDQSKFKFTPKHKSKSYTSAATNKEDAEAGGADEG